MAVFPRFHLLFAWTHSQFNLYVLFSFFFLSLVRISHLKMENFHRDKTKHWKYMYKSTMTRQSVHNNNNKIIKMYINRCKCRESLCVLFMWIVTNTLNSLTNKCTKIETVRFYEMKKKTKNGRTKNSKYKKYVLCGRFVFFFCNASRQSVCNDTVNYDQKEKKRKEKKNNFIRFRRRQRQRRRVWTAQYYSQFSQNDR